MMIPNDEAKLAPSSDTNPVNISGVTEANASLINCPSCNSQNQSQRKFCSECGTGLTLNCVDCGEPNKINERFCGQCGSNLTERISAQKNSFEQVLTEAENILKQGKYDEACAHLKSIAVAKHAGEEEFAKKAQSRIEEIRYEKEQIKASAQEFLEDAEVLFEEKKINEVLKGVSHFPPALRPVKLQKLYNDAKDIESEIHTLYQEIKSAIKAKQTRHLLPKVERLLALNPYDEKIVQLKQKLIQQAENSNLQLKKQLSENAKKSVLQFEYENAIELLSNVPSDVRTDKFNQLYSQVRELVWLERDLHYQPYVSSAMLEVGKKFLSKVPKDQKNLDRLKKVDKILKQHKENSTTSLKWKTPPKSSSLGFPLETKAELLRINNSKINQNEAFQENSSVFNISIGLALQGLGLTKIQSNLLPSKNKGVFGKIGISIGRKNQSDSAWGIEVNDTGLCAIQLNNDSEIKAVECFATKHKFPISKSNISDRRGILQDTINKLIESIGIDKLQSSAICINLESSEVIGRFLNIPPVEDKVLNKTIEYEVRHQVPFPLEDLQWASHLWEQTAENEGRKCLVVATRLEQIKERLEIFQECKLTPEIIQCDQIAIHNLTAHEFFQNEKTSQSFAMLDIGTNISNLVVSSNNSLWFRNISVGSDDLLRALVQHTDYSFSQAEMFLKRPSQVDSVSKFYQHIEPGMINLRNEVQHTLKHFSETNKEKAIGKIYLLNGGQRIYGLERYLQYGDDFNP